MLSPERAGEVEVTASPSASVSSTGTTVSAPGGIGAPVMIRTHVPRATRRGPHRAGDDLTGDGEAHRLARVAAARSSATSA
jgi:hypothetical protein